MIFFKERLERFTPVALYKRATMSNSLRSLMTKSNRSDSLFFMSEFLFRSQKMSESLQKPMSKFPTLYIDRVLQDTLQSPIRKIKKLLVKIVPLQHRYKDEQKKDKQTRCSERVVFRESCRTFYLQKLSRLSNFCQTICVHYLFSKFHDRLFCRAMGTRQFSTNIAKMQ